MAELRIEQLLREMVNRKASDLHLRVGVPPVYRINGALQRLFDVRIDSAMMDSFLDDIMNRDQKQRFEANKECDFAVGARDMGRFRVNVFRQRGTIAVVIRHIKAVIPAFEDLHLPEVIRDLALTKRGLVLVTGTTGSGKSTTLASMIDYINQKESVNVITVEDPIEYLYKDNVAIISQREIGVDTLSYANALRAALRQDPDVLLVGEIRDLETMQIALTAADTGHMVFATIHTTNAVETIHRVLSMYPPHQHDEVRLLLAEVLAGIISLRLLPTKDGKGRVPAAEILVNTGAIKEYIQDKNKIDMVEQAVAEGHIQYHSQTFDQALLELYQNEQISLETAMNAATNRDDFDLKIRGISGTSDRGWM
ncbi:MULTISPECIES: type IV pilus twitching motility protein PilT [unclassified Fibrobacter]|uniref:type IV pilus twitching motility protein PilT n=1 Tax=unclassified Fibrobacter TaxID=2634177 RepID=UPI0009132CE4|nr:MULTISPECIES: type IV pilus twitching motility protein PilT [unclassified Fibrobacter]MBQ3777032.1 type IV pilus twitching motility protein PilT [Fibrobacter sp.]SHM44731.1 twitching motility protein PilT [Fibrobacter sp. UWB7]SMG14788.1 twitching motility protein PilT [Fibrobacter sp. UWB13]